MADIGNLQAMGAVETPPARGGIRREVGYLYSAYLMPTSLTAGTRTTFQTQVGATGQGSSNALTYVETNLENAGRIPDSTSWVITDLGIGFNTSTALADIKKIVDNSYVQLNKPGYQRVLGAMMFWPGGWGLNGSVATTENNVVYQTWSNGQPAVFARRKLAEPIILNKGTTFSVDLVTGNSGYSTQTLSATTWTWVAFWGVRLEQIAQ